MIIEHQGFAISLIRPNTLETADTRDFSVSIEPAVLEDITSDSETVVGATESPDGLTRRADGTERRVDVPVVVLVTDRRVLFVSGEAGAEGGVDAGELAYADVAAVRVEDGRLAVADSDGVEWCLAPSSSGPEPADPVVRHLRWIGRIRSRVLACATAVERAAAAIRDHADATDWEEVEAAYGRARAELDGAIGAVQRTTPVGDDDLAPRLTDLARDLEAAYVAAVLSRAESRLALAESLVAEGVFDRARVLLERTREDHETAREHALAVERADEFQFGPQRSVHERLERLGWEIEAVAAGPLRAAHEAKLHAHAVEGATDKVEHWERTFQRFGRVLALVEDDPDPAFAGDAPDVRGELSNAAGRLVAIHRALARIEWNAGVGRATAGDGAAPTDALDAAVEHVERACDLADRFHPEGSAELDRLLAAMRSARDRVGATGDVAHLVATDDLTDGPAPSGAGAGGDWPDATDGPRRELVAGPDPSDVEPASRPE